MNTNTNISEEELELIERYILNTMTPDEHAAFTSRLTANVELQSKVEEIKLLVLGVNEAVLKEQLEAFHKELPKEEKEKVPGKVASLNRWLVAAAVIVFVAVGAWLLFGRAGRQEKLFSAYYKPDPGLISAMSTTDNYTFDRAMIDYKTGSYDSAIRAWQTLLATKPGNDTLNYFIGSAWLAKEETNKAVPYFKQVIAVPGSYFLKDANWYLGLALLRENKTAEAIPFINQSGREQKDAVLLKLKQ